MYCLETLDNPGVDIDVQIDPASPAGLGSDRLGGIIKIAGRTKRAIRLPGSRTCYGATEVLP